MVPRGFLVSAVLYGLLGLSLGLHMAISGNHEQMPTHAHLMVLTWLSFFVFGLYYTLIPGSHHGILPRIHFWLAQLAAPVMLFGVFSIHAGNMAMEPAAAIGSMAYALSFVIFAVVLINWRPAVIA
jgi:hypothetical protein